MMGSTQKLTSEDLLLDLLLSILEKEEFEPVFGVKMSVM